MVLSIIVIAVKPYKTSPSNSNLACAAYIQVLAFIFATFSAAGLLSGFMNQYAKVALMLLSFLASCVPLADAFRILVMFLVRRRRGIFQQVASCCGRRNQYEELPGDNSGEEETLSDRSDNLQAYQNGNLSSFAALQN